MDVFLLQGIIAILIFQPCKSQDDVTVMPFAVESDDPKVAPALVEEITEHGLTAQTGGDVTEDTHMETEHTQPREPEEQGDTYVPLMSQGSEVIEPEEEREAGWETNDLSVMNNTEDPPPHTDSTEQGQTVRTGDLQEASHTPEFTETEPDIADLESWRIGAISVVASLSLGVVIAIYCLKFRKRRRRPEVPVKNNDDSEAGETIHGESNENTLTAGDARNIQNMSNGSLDLTTTKQEASLSAGSVDSPTEAVSCQDLSSDVRTIVV